MKAKLWVQSRDVKARVGGTELGCEGRVMGTEMGCEGRVMTTELGCDGSYDYRAGL